MVLPGAVPVLEARAGAAVLLRHLLKRRNSL